MRVGGQPADEDEAQRVHDAIIVLAVKDRLARAIRRAGEVAGLDAGAGADARDDE